MVEVKLTRRYLVVIGYKLWSWCKRAAHNSEFAPILYLIVGPTPSLPVATVLTFDVRPHTLQGILFPHYRI